MRKEVVLSILISIGISAVIGWYSPLKTNEVLGMFALFSPILFVACMTLHAGYRACIEQLWPS